MPSISFWAKVYVKRKPQVVKKSCVAGVALGIFGKFVEGGVHEKREAGEERRVDGGK
jgi:hypothetical protein